MQRTSDKFSVFEDNKYILNLGGNKMSNKKINLTSSEIASLWGWYMNESMSKIVLSFMLKHVEDIEIRPVIQSALDISTNHIKKLNSIFKNEDYAVPNGFSDKDVNKEAPWLFTDTFCLNYVNHMSRIGMLTYSGFLSMSYKKNLRDNFIQAINETMSLYDQTMDIALSKGIIAKHPYIEVPKETDYVKSKEYLSGLNPFNEKRPLNSVEISYLYSNILTNSIGSKLCLAFAQTSPSKEIQDFMLRGKDISQKHIKIFTDAMLNEDIVSPNSDLGISNSTAETFSDKLMMFHISTITSAGIGNYATAGAASQRSDLIINYERLSLEVARLAKSGADIMIKHHWLEQPPGTKSRKKLVKNKEDN